MKQRRLRAITLQGAIEKSTKMNTIFLYFGGTNNILADCTLTEISIAHCTMLVD